MANSYNVNFDINPPVYIRVVEPEKSIDLELGLEISGIYSYSVNDEIAFYHQGFDIENEDKRAEFEGRLFQSMHCAMSIFWSERVAKGIKHDDIPDLFDELKTYVVNDLQGGFCKITGIKLDGLEFNKTRINPSDEKIYHDMLVFYMNNVEFKHIHERIGEIREELKECTDNEKVLELQAEVISLQNRMSEISKGVNASGADVKDTPNGQPAPTSKIPPKTKYKWQCPCGRVNETMFCPGCGRPKDATSVMWICSCGKKNNTRFCTNCGNRRD